ncbi:fasciclin domain-containing protein [Tanticharoenia sakaeratensis]|jgi:uncharacterized surface protein with fasciclin (FAS1) repeats|uniref:Beta-Ig-H3/fasciclin n=1 Tax=Tanticharoenia sakaeratensis NBRC 103193 TaxID=1231623 RepID=A0A0D6MPQ4_9PROT|nr:hypothetical protein [Tanticharoenia sakaeratensis]GAN55687.1 beta-Ig-H3/fasciclin [Tanticharoenia sakaeratensis NBRC 103193]GBQ18641.1 beta-Ig-H3/fasciclin repeat containing protein [Tanticharoenia sakaeratensis NBRC 103193]
MTDNGWYGVRRARCLVALVLPFMVAACESGAQQDPLPLRGGTSASLMPASAEPARQLPSPDAKFGAGGAPDSPVAYERPAAPSYPDRPLSENLASSLEVADYVHGLDTTGLSALLRRAGPFTVFAIPNRPLERFAGQWSGSDLYAPASQPVLKRLLGYTIVRGRWDEARLRRVIARTHGTAVALKTISGDPLTVAVEPSTGQLVLANAKGATNRLWFISARQSNGVLYFTQDILPPA